MASWRYLLQIPAYAVFIGVVGYFSIAPEYQHVDPELAMIRLAFSHAAERVEPCRELSPAELAALPPNMRQPKACGRERLPVVVEFEIDGELVYRAAEIPTGVWKDGASTVYQKFIVPAGTHEMVVRLRDKRDTEGFDYEESATVALAPGQNFVIGFRAETGGFKFQ
ncbi:MAG: hypothetical protein QNJ73_17240 [Gammaproteobacteria bacterium]|nr:hypothetical protein [Gammaproteobacteria bacterium]